MLYFTFKYFIYCARPNDDAIALNGMNKVILCCIALHCIPIDDDGLL